MTRRRQGLRLRVDPIACDAFGYCAELLPERVHLDEWGYPIVDGTPVRSDLVDLAQRAAAECPRRAILLVRETTPEERRQRPDPPVRRDVANASVTTR